MTNDPVTAYARQVLAGDIVAGPYVRAACERHLRDLARDDIHFDVDAATRVFSFFRDELILSEGQFDGSPFVLHPSQQFIVGSVFGWKKSNGNRRFRRAYIEQSKGNGKSPLVGGIGLYGLSADRESGAQIYSAGSTKQQASILFNDAVNMAKRCPKLHSRMKYSGIEPCWNMAMIGPPQNGSFFRPISKEAGKTGSGPRPHMALCDEVHEYKSRTILDMLERGFKFRRQPLLVMITNSGTDKRSVCWEEHEHAVRVAQGLIEDDDTFSYVCALDPGDDPLVNEDCWIKTNPLLDVIVTREYLRGVVDQARKFPGKRNGILRLHFCIWTDAETAWVTRETWEACEDGFLDIRDFAGKPCRAGLDLSSTQDLTATALVFDDGFAEVDGKRLPKFAAFVHGYTPRDSLAVREERDRTPYAAWVDGGFLTPTPGKVVRYDYVATDLAEASELYRIELLAYDQYLIQHFQEACDELGLALPMADHPQGFNRRRDSELWMPESIKTLETLILERRLRVHVNPALRGAVASAKFVESPAGLRRFDKGGATARIDLLMALTMAIGASYSASKQSRVSPYDVLDARRKEGAAIEIGEHIDYAALNNPRHRDHAETKRRFERKQRLDDLKDDGF